MPFEHFLEHRNHASASCSPQRRTSTTIAAEASVNTCPSTSIWDSFVADIPSHVFPLVTDILNDRETHNDEELEQSLLEDLADETLVNNQGLARKDPLFIGALALLVLAVLLELTGVQ
jgi:hypothetical protein